MLEKLGESLKSIRPLIWIMAWKEAAGPVFTQKAKFLGVHNSPTGRVLLLEIDDPMWREEFKYYAEQILNSYNMILEKQGVHITDRPRSCQLRSWPNSNKTSKKK